jgi:hypothetical protein
MFLAQSMSKAFAACKAWQPEDLSYRDVPLIACPIDDRCHHNGLQLGILDLDCVAARFGHRLPLGFARGKEAVRITLVATADFLAA